MALRPSRPGISQVMRSTASPMRLAWMSVSAVEMG
jgi:hypothetical protein